VGHFALNAKLPAIAGIIPAAHQTANLARTSTQLFSAQQPIVLRGLFKQTSIRHPRYLSSLESWLGGDRRHQSRLFSDQEQAIQPLNKGISPGKLVFSPKYH
jgi:hypothetical protein